MIAIIITRETTDDFPDGRACPPVDDLGRLWVLVRHLPDQRSMWRSISINPHDRHAAGDRADFHRR
jgi:hypothetical protein